MTRTCQKSDEIIYWNVLLRPNNKVLSNINETHSVKQQSNMVV